MLIPISQDSCSKQIILCLTFYVKMNVGEIYAWEVNELSLHLHPLLPLASRSGRKNSTEQGGGLNDSDVFIWGAERTVTVVLSLVYVRHWSF